MAYKRSISNTDDTLDSRDVIERLDELTDAAESAAEIALANWRTDLGIEDEDARPEFDLENLPTGTWKTADGAVYHDDFSEDDYNELQALKSLAEEASGSPDWRHGETLIRDDYFEEYAEQLAEDIGAVNPKATWPNNHIDWEAAAEALKQDYFSVTWDGVDYWIRA